MRARRYFGDTSSTGGNAGLPDLTASENGWRVRFIKGDAANTLILTPNSGDMIEGATTYTINAQNEIVDVVWTGTTWEITSHDYNRPLPLSAGGLGASSASGGRSTLGLGTAATEDAGTASGDVALLQSGGVFSQDRIPTLSASKVPNLQALNGILDVASGGTGVTSYTALEAALNLGSDTGPVLAIRRRDTVDAQSGSYTLLAADEGKTLLWDTSSGGGNAGLPDLVSSENGWRARFIKGDAANTLILTPDGSDMIEGASTFTIHAQNEIIDVVWTGTTWEIISHTHVRPLPLMAGGLGASTAMGGRSTLGTRYGCGRQHGQQQRQRGVAWQRWAVRNGSDTEPKRIQDHKWHDARGAVAGAPDSGRRYRGDERKRGAFGAGSGLGGG